MALDLRAGAAALPVAGAIEGGERRRTRLDRRGRATVNVFFAFAAIRRLSMSRATRRCRTTAMAKAMRTRHATRSTRSARARSTASTQAMHGLLIERGEIIDRLIARQEARQERARRSGPAREADMMRRLVERHKGILPLDTAESIWRVIIATFTYRAGAVLGARRSFGRRRARCATARASISASRCRSCAHMGAAARGRRGRRRPQGDLGLVPALPMRRRRRLVERARVRRRAEDHRAPAVRRARRPSGRRCRSS